MKKTILIDEDITAVDIGKLILTGEGKHVIIRPIPDQICMDFPELVIIKHKSTFVAVQEFSDTEFIEKIGSTDAYGNYYLDTRDSHGAVVIITPNDLTIRFNYFLKPDREFGLHTCIIRSLIRLGVDKSLFLDEVKKEPYVIVYGRKLSGHSRDSVGVHCSEICSLYFKIDLTDHINVFETSEKMELNPCTSQGLIGISELLPNTTIPQFIEVLAEECESYIQECLETYEYSGDD